MNSANLVLSFDIGYRSIGWSVIEQNSSDQAINIQGCGTVTFEADDCQTSTRRDYRRTRRNIRATRQRIERLKKWLEYHKFLSREQMDKPGVAYTHFLAARVLQNKCTLSREELWNVIRWYAHNRGYDGNSRWSKQELGGNEESATAANNDDTEKVKQAKNIMATHATNSMAETICALQGLDLNLDKPSNSHQTPSYKSQNCAFERNTVMQEITRILQAHARMFNLSDDCLRLLLTAEELTAQDRVKLAEAGVKFLPKRYYGGLLFGQLVPRFDNRIIARCPISWANLYDSYTKQGMAPQLACKKADAQAKVPSKKCPEFLQYRFARIVANLRADSQPLAVKTRLAIWNLAQEKGRLTPTELKKVIQQEQGTTNTNVGNYFELHPESEKALVFDYGQAEAYKAQNVTKHHFNKFWSHFPETLQKICMTKWRDGKAVNLQLCIDWLQKHQYSEQLQAIEKILTLPLDKKLTNQQYLQKTIGDTPPSGRAPYSKSVLKQVVEQVLNGLEPTAKEQDLSISQGSNECGVLYSLNDPDSRVRALEKLKNIDDLTNNQMVRHRLLILQRLLKELIEHYAQGEASQISDCVVEIGREVKEYSGKTAKEITTIENQKLANFNKAKKHLQDHHIKVNANLLRKCQIAMDLNWTCPFTGCQYDVHDLAKLELEHIIPYSQRNSNAMAGLVLTYKEVNRMKGKRTAKQFILECGSMQVEGLPNLSIQNSKSYDAFVDKLNTKGAPSDQLRKKARQKFLKLESFDERKNEEFTSALLTQSSQLMKLATHQIKQMLPQARVSNVPGVINAEIRKSWKLLDCLHAAYPEIVVTQEDGSSAMLTKSEIRSLTHLHHALDAATLGLGAVLVPGHNNGKVWQLLTKRSLSDEECSELKLHHIIQLQAKRAVLGDLPERLRQQLRQRLCEKRVVQHIPSDYSGCKAELTTWRIEAVNDNYVQLSQRTKDKNGNNMRKTAEENANKLLGFNPKNGKGKLQQLKGVMVIKSNYGLALDPKPEVIPHHNVHQRLCDLYRKNDNKPIRILRNGMLISVENAKNPANNGLWMIRSVKNSNSGAKVDLRRPEDASSQTKGRTVWREVMVASLLKNGLKLLPKSYLGIKQ